MGRQACWYMKSRREYNQNDLNKTITSATLGAVLSVAYILETHCLLTPFLKVIREREHALDSHRNYKSQCGYDAKQRTPTIGAFT